MQTQIRNLYVAWHSACERAGCAGKRIHDLRRTVRRRYVRSGVPEEVAMELLGHKTRAIFDRYHIVSDTDLAEAVAEDARGAVARAEHACARLLTRQESGAWRSCW